jgi:hypothetical protein
MRRVCLIVSIFLLACGAGRAQTTAGSIVGLVTDASGAAVPHATVTVTNMGTNIAVKTTTSTSGNYVVTPLSVGTYSVTVRAPGFKEETRSGVRVDVQSRVATNFVLQVGPVTQTVTVRAPNPLLQTKSSYVGQIMETNQVNDLPLNGRLLTRLALLAPAATPETTGSKDAITGGFSVNGLRPYQNTYLLDGINNNNYQAGLTGGVDYVIGPPPDAVNEFRLQTNNMSAEFGTSAGGVMNVTIKSGTNELHGDAYEYARNSAFDAKNYFNSLTAPIPEYQQNQFGFTVGGPLVIPKVYNGKDKTFFFADYEGTRIREGESFVSTVAPVAWRSGDFSGFQPIYDPATTTILNGVATRQPFPGNIVPATRFDSVSAKLIQIMPLPNQPGTVSASGVANNFLYTPTYTQDEDQFDVRLDHHFSDKDSAFARFSFFDEPELRPPALPIGDGSIRDGLFNQNGRQGVIGYTHIFNPQTIDEFHAGYTYDYLAEQIFNYATEGDLNGSAQLGILGIPFTSAAWLNGGTPEFDVTGLTSFGSAESEPTIDGGTVLEFNDILTMVRGSHTIKTGAQWYPIVNIPFLQPKYPRGDFQFNGDPTRNPSNLTTTGLGMADFLLGDETFAGLSNGVYDTFQQPGYAFFAQDDYQMTRKLTWDLGLRYQFISNPMEAHNAESNFNLATDTLDIVAGRNDSMPAYFASTGFPVSRNASRTLVPNHHLDFAPRLGVAYDFLPKTVFRAGYGIFWTGYEAGPLSSPNMGENLPFYSLVTYPEESVVTPNPIVSQLSQGFPANALSTGSTGQPSSLFSLSPDFANPYEEVWHAGVEQELPAGMVWKIDYAGSEGVDLYLFLNPNQPVATPNPNIPLNSRRPFPTLESDLTLWCSCAPSNYNALQTSLEKRFSNGLSFLAAYSWGKTIDWASEASLGEGSGQAGFRNNYQPGWERGLADFDVGQRFAFSYIYDLPVGRARAFGRNMNGAANVLFGGWDLVGIDSFQTGYPLTISSAENPSNSDGQQRGNIVLGVRLIPANQNVNEWYNPAHFTEAAPGTYGNAGRDILTGPGFAEVDFSLFKNFQLSERFRLQFRAEVFNLFNRPNFESNGIQDNFDLPGAGSLTAANPARQIQFALKLFY